jgi:glycosyltransferase involved in cell wall biosynthesis
MLHPLISIVLCSYNGATFIEEQIQSLLHQTYTNLEIIVSDDGSSDGTQAILENYKSHPLFKIFFQQQNLGPIQNVAFAVEQATGAYIAFCDQDDVWLPHKIETLYAAMGGALLVYSDSLLVDEQGNSLDKKLSQLRNMYTGKDTRGFVFSNVVWGHTIMISRELLPAILPIPGGVPHDIWMAVKAASIRGIKYLDVPLTKYRQHDATITKTIATDRQGRTTSKKYIDFKEKLYWIEVMQQHARDEEQPFYKQLYTLYASKESGAFQWPLFFFMLKNRRFLYQFSKKSSKSQIVDILKHARGVQA